MSRIYIVKPKNATNGERLISAASRAKAQDVLLRDFTIEIAKPEDAFRLAQAGVELEVNRSADEDAL